MVETSVISTPELKKASKNIGARHNSPLIKRILKPQNFQDNINDDDAERSNLLAEERAQRSSLVSSVRSSIDLTKSPQKEHFQGCLKLYAENKINKDNAWNLQLIDFMQSMLKKHDKRMEDLQTASTVVDASAKIYSFRVDAVHYDVIKMAGGLTKAAQMKRGKKDDDDAPQEEEVPDGEAAAANKRKKKKNKSVIVSKPELLNGDFDTNDFIDPFFEKLAATAGDVASCNRAFNATLPINDNTLSLILRTDDPFLEPIQENECEDIDLTQRITLPVKMLPAFTNDDIICEPFAGFSISNWDPETEETEHRTAMWVEENRLNLSQQAVAFDVNGEVEPIPQEDPANDFFDAEPPDGAESDEERSAAVVARAAGHTGGAGVARVTDMRPSGLRDVRLEYSYSSAIVAWSGPQHWRLKNNRASRNPERTQTVIEGKRPARTKRQLEFTVAGLCFDWRSPTADYEPTQPAKITISQKTLAISPTWHQRNFQMPLDRGFDESHFRKLQLCPNKAVVPLWEKVMPPEPLQLEPTPYDYNNENDASYCPQTVMDNDEWGNEEMGATGEAVPLVGPDDLGDMVEPPAKVAKIFIPYAMRAKKVDMKQLKHCTWKMLHQKSPDGEEAFKPTKFSELYSDLPHKLSESQRESLSVPLALLSVLHLANEKGLILNNGTSLTDFDIVGRIS